MRRTKQEQAVIDKYGGNWGSHPKYPVKDWQYQVANNDTRLGYWDWVFDELSWRER